ncbi:carbohydrate porin [Vibrio lentus]|nr:carbohydrate porin [Vibrio lentus]
MINWELYLRLVRISSLATLSVMPCRRGVGANNSDDDSFSAVIRPLYKWDKRMRTILEIVVALLKLSITKDGAGGKFTIAQAWVPQVGFWSRPEFRIFATY